jgi:GH15 family glucan-1,4-alpha-glucosidase
LIGNCLTAALVGREGSIDWWCPARFDAPAVLCRILGAERGGFFSVRPAGTWDSSRQYVGDTNVLLTIYRSRDAELRVTDYMPMRSSRAHGSGADQAGKPVIVRRIEVTSGDAEVRVRYRPSCEYGLGRPVVESVSDRGLVTDCGDMYLGVFCPTVGLRESGGVWEAALELKAGDQYTVALEHSSSREEALAALNRPMDEDDLPRTVEFWKNWARRCSYRGPYRAAVVRSALTLKMLSYNPAGSLVAAPTTSLPEDIGGERNWDYRFTWLRDTTLIVYALTTLNYHHEAVRFLHWLESVMKHRLDETPQIMYEIDGGRCIPEKKLFHLDGYRGSRPVRVGNAAANQRQLDIYGEILTAAYVHYHRPDEQPGRSRHGHAEKPDAEAWQTLRALVDDAVDHWEEPDNGIWEVRGGLRHFLYSKLMCWAAVDRGIRLASEHGLDADLECWRRTRDRMRERIEVEGYNDKLGCFTQSFGSDTVDAAALAIPRVGFLSATDPRVLSTIDRIKKDLVQDGLVYRYRTPDGLVGGEGTFLLCTFWLVEALALAGRVDEATELYEQTIALANDLGLFSEELDAKTKEFLGNFPQGFTHLSLIRAAVDLARARVHGPEERRVTEGERARRAHRAASR